MTPCGQCRRRRTRTPRRLDVERGHLQDAALRRRFAAGDLTRNFEVNTYGIFYCGQSAARAMIGLSATPGRIINTASMAAKQGGVPFLSDYVASKFSRCSVSLPGDGL